MLNKIKNLLQTNGAMTAPMLARELKATEPAVLGMLNLLITRGKVSLNNHVNCAGSCCSSHSTLYSWQEKPLIVVSQI